MQRLTPVSLQPGAADHAALRKAFGRFATGVTVITTRGPGGRLEGLTANSFASVSLDPPLVLWSLRRDARSAPSFIEHPNFAVNVLAADQQALARRFSLPADDKFNGVEAKLGAGGCPLIAGAIAHFECARETTVPGGDHIVFIGRVLAAAHRDGEPLIFANGGYLAGPMHRLAVAAE